MTRQAVESLSCCKRIYRDQEKLKAHKLRVHHYGTIRCSGCGLWIAGSRYRAHSERHQRRLPSKTREYRHILPKPSCLVKSIESHPPPPSSMISPKLLPSPHFPYAKCLPSRSISPFFLNHGDINQVLLADPNMMLSNQQYGNNTILADEGEEGIPHVVPPFQALDLDSIDPTISQTMPFDLKSMFSETASLYLNNIERTLTAPLTSGLYPENFHLSSQRSLISNTDMPDFDIPVASIELLDFDHPSAEDAIVADLSIDVASMEQTDWRSLGLESIPSLSENHAQNE